MQCYGILCYDEWESNGMIWDFNADSNILLWDSNVMLHVWYGVCLKAMLELNVVYYVTGPTREDTTKRNLLFSTIKVQNKLVILRTINYNINSDSNIYSDTTLAFCLQILTC